VRSDPSSERVLVVPTARLHEAGLFHGFSPRVEHYLPLLLDAQPWTGGPPVLRGEAAQVVFVAGEVGLAEQPPHLGFG
jgi:hypothetical protein